MRVHRAIQYPLWLGKGGWMRGLGRGPPQVRGARPPNRARLEIRNSALAADVRDLKQGTDAIEERARYELGMVKNDEMFFQVPSK